MTEFIDSLIWLGVGFGFGCVFMLNHKSYKDSKTFEQVDESIRNQLAVKTNLVDSLKKDLEYAKQKIEALKDHK